MPQPRVMETADDPQLSLGVEFVLEHMYAAEGAQCPCCGGTVKVKRYAVSTRQARELRTLYDARPEALHWKEWLTSSARMQCVLRFAGLISQPTGDPDKPFNRSGAWAITQRGIDWIEGNITIPRFVYVLFNQIVGYSPEQLTYQEALDHPYTPEDAMQAVDANEVIET